MQKDTAIKIKEEADSTFAGQNGTIHSVHGEFVKIQLEKYPNIKPILIGLSSCFFFLF